MEREVRYCTVEGGTRVAYCLQGQGYPLIMLPFFMEAFEIDHLVPDVRDFYAHLARSYMVIRFDYPGTGFSEGGADGDGDFQGNLLRFIAAILDAEGIERCAMWGSTTSGIAAMWFAALAPERVSHLLLFGTYARADDVFPAQALEAFIQIARNSWPVLAHLFADMTGRKQFPDVAMQLGDWYQRSTTGDWVASVMEWNIGMDVTPVLHRITARTLVLHRIGDPTIPVALGRQVAAGIKDAKLILLDGEHHHFAFGDSESVLHAIEGFVPKEPVAELPAHGSFRTVLVSDLVGHTEMMRRLGDERGRALLREHERITRSVLKQYDGAEIKTMGDGFMASFASVTSAVECAIALQRSFTAAALGAADGGTAPAQALAVRIGLNAGEPIEDDGDLFGSAVILASRVAACAGAGEILLPEPLRHLLSGKTYVYADRGERMLKGFEDSVRLYEIRWRD